MSRRDIHARAVDPLQYDAEDIDWAPPSRRDAAREEHIWAHVASLAPTWRGRDVIDVGAGTGWLLERVLAAGARSVVGIEPSARNVAAGRARHPAIELARATLEEFAPPRRFDVALLVMVLPNLGDLDRAFGSLRDLLAPDGELQALVTAYSRSPRQWEVDRDERNPQEYAVLLEHPRGALADVIRDPALYVEAAARQGLALLGREPTPPYELLRFRHQAG
jgi:SAM-dependent methyltransferase